ncbi:IS21-like element helper ATPase IstB [Crocinitomicaceae bacterium]|jgi:DNA replication protein DnaC|nr:IS21-like element helper ATPase IstB [Crocinitomicaceae bacterium]
MMTAPTDPIPRIDLHAQVSTLKLYGLLAHWDELTNEALAIVAQWIAWETHERQQRGLKRRLRAAHIGRFKPLADFDWDWPSQCDKATVSTLMTLDFITEAVNVILVGPNGVGKSLIAQNLAHQAVIHGHSALFVNAAQMLGDLAAQDGDNALRRRFAHYARPDVLVIDEIGYLSYGTRHADLLFEIINRRYERKPTIITTNRPFAEWSEVFPNAACVVSIVDRLIHHAEILVIEGESYRMREAKERAARKPPARKRQHRTQPAAKGGS